MAAGIGFIGFAIIELMGHQSIAGRLSEQTLAGEGYLHVDVPRKGGGYYTRILGRSAVYAINICGLEAAREYALRMPEPTYHLEALEEIPGIPAISGSSQPGEERACGLAPGAIVRLIGGAVTGAGPTLFPRRDDDDDEEGDYGS